MEKSLHLDTGAPSDAIGYEDFRASEGLWRESEAFLRHQAATVFENSTAYVYVETLVRLAVCDPGERNEPCLVPSGTDFERKLEVKASACGRKSIFHGEFDPGSGRTLAARLTHASRARTSPSGLGTAANG